MARWLCHTEELNSERAPFPEFSPETPEAHKCPPSHPSSAHHLCGASCHPPASPWSEYPLTLPPASGLRNPPRPVDPLAPPWLLAPSSPPWPGSPLALPGSLVPPAPPWSGIDHPVPRDPPGSTPPRRSPATSAPPWTSGSSPSPWLIGSLGLLHHLFRLPPVSSLAPPSFITALVSVCPLPLPGKCYGVERAFREGGVMSRPWTVFVVFLLHVCSVTQFLPCVFVIRFRCVLWLVPHYLVFKSPSLSSLCLSGLLCCYVCVCVCVQLPLWIISWVSLIKDCWTFTRVSCMLPPQRIVTTGCSIGHIALSLYRLSTSILDMHGVIFLD